MVYRCDVAVADEFPVAVIMSRRKRQDFVGQPHQIFRFAGKQDRAVSVVAVIQRTNADRVAGGDKFFLLSVVENAGKLRVQLFKHADAVFFIHGQQHFAVGLAGEGVVLGQFLFKLFKAVNLAVADHPAAVQAEGLHPFRVKPHDGESVKAEYPLPHVNDAGIIRAAGNCFGEACLKGCHIGRLAAVPNDGTHIGIPPQIARGRALRLSHGFSFSLTPVKGWSIPLSGAAIITSHQTAIRRRWGTANNRKRSGSPPRPRQPGGLPSCREWCPGWRRTLP